MIAHYKAVARPNGNFDAVYAILGAQRNAKIIGIFTRLWKRDGKLRYLSFLPRMWNLLERDLAHPAPGSVAAWFAANDRKSVVLGKSVSVRVDRGGCRIMKKKKISIITLRCADLSKDTNV